MLKKNCNPYVKKIGKLKVFCGKIALNLAKLISCEYALWGVGFIEHMGRRGTNALGCQIKIGKRIDFAIKRVKIYWNHYRK